MGEERDGTSDKKDGIKPSQVTAAALAAVTAAFLGSTLGVAGTVAGAGIASVVSTVGGELYLRSMRKTKEAAQRTREAALALTDSGARQQAGPVPQPRQVPGQRTDNYHPPAQAWPGRRNDMRPGAGYQPPREQWQPANSRMPGAGARRSVGEEPTVALPQLNLRSPGAESGAEQARRGYRLHWPLIVGTSVVGFLIAILMITGFEGVTGKSISGDEVTTVGHLWSGGGSDKPDDPSTSGGDETVQPSESRVPTTTTPQHGTEGGKQPTTSGSAPSTSVPNSSTPSTSVPKSSTPSTGVPESSNQSRTPNFPSSNNAPGGKNQRPGSDGGDGAPGPTNR
ncbi:hypothetical protein [Nocardia suismassiliense]|uniref:hypothetical protein n=1 Tax=Nocardia suismassiliense TaxID=2077092 RepID=UPI0018FE9553|nr:hypothetical protein [Nocardia suismassiliense]